MQIQQIYLAVEQRAFGHDRLGFSSNEDFNRDFATAQRLLFDYCIRTANRDSARTQLLAPFKRSGIFMVADDGSIPMPAHRIVVEVTNLSGDRGSHVGDGSFRTQSASFIRGSRSRCHRINWEAFGTGIRISGISAGKSVKVEYLIDPPAASRGVQYDTVSYQELYDPNTTIEPIWPQAAQEDLIQILLALRGLDMESSDLIQFVRASYATKPQ